MAADLADESKKTLRIGLISGVHTLDPSRAQDFVVLMVVSQIFERPFAPPVEGRPAQPILLQERLVAESADHTVFSAAVRDDVLFSDGTPLSAEIVAASLSRVSHLRDQATFDAKGGRLFIELERPNASFDLVLAAPYCGVALESDDELLGTGPFMPAPDSTSDRVRLVRNPNSRAETSLDELAFIHYPLDESREPSALLRAFEEGEVDFTNVLRREEISGMSNVKKLFALGNSTAILYFNTETKGLDRSEVRRALALAIDRTEVASLSYAANPLAITATGLLPPMMSDWRDGITYDLERAKKALTETGVDFSRPLRMMVMFGPRPYLPRPRAVAHYIAGQLGRLGVEVEVAQTRDSEDYFRTGQSGRYDLALTGWIPETLDPADYLESVLAPDSIPTLDRPVSIHANLSRWRKEEVNRLLRELRTLPGGGKQEEILRLVAHEMPLLPLITGSAAYVHAFHVKNFVADPLGIPDFSKLDLRVL